MVSAYALPLRGIRVANFGVGGVAPWASSLLAQLGATVVKIEAPNRIHNVHSASLARTDDDIRGP